MKHVKAIWELMRLEHGVMIFIAIVIGSLITQRVLFEYTGLPPLTTLVLTFCTALFLEASTFALNDYFDVEIDKMNRRRDRPLVRGDLSPRAALVVFFVLFPLGIVASFFVNETCFVIALITALFAIVYDVVLKKIKMVGNFFIAYTMAVPFLFGAAAVLPTGDLSYGIPLVVFVLSLIAFFAGSGREMMKDVMDVEGDRVQGVKSFPMVLGVYGTQVLAALFYGVAIVLSFVPFVVVDFSLFYQNYVYLLVVVVADVLFLFVVYRLVHRRGVDARRLRQVTLGALFVGLIAFLLGVFVG